MASVTGFGGIFLRAEDPKALYQWYEQHLGLVKAEGAFSFTPPTRHPHVVFALFKQDNAYFPPAQKATNEWPAGAVWLAWDGTGGPFKPSRISLESSTNPHNPP